MDFPEPSNREEPINGWRINPNESQIQDDSIKSISACASSTTLRGSVKAEAEKFHAMGYEARKKGDYKTAITMYTKAIASCEGFFKAYFNRGFALDKIGEFEKAIADYAKALEIEPKNAYVYYNRGVSLDKLQRYDGDNLGTN